MSKKAPTKGETRGKAKQVKPTAVAAPMDQARLRKATMVLGPVLVLNVALAWRRGADWKSDHTLFATAIEVVPGSARAHHNYGSALLNEGKPSLAIPELLKASEILPSWSDPHAQLGAAMFDLERKSEAETHFRKAVELEPSSAKAVFNLAVYLAREGRLAEAKGVLDPFVRKNPGRTREASLLQQINADLEGPGGK
jgi:Flp pilus assembly protein TadD